MKGEVEAEPWVVDREDFQDLEQIQEEDCNLNSKTIQASQDKAVEECRWMLCLLVLKATHLPQLISRLRL